MVDVSDKPVTSREAEATAVITMRKEVLDAVIGGSLAKGDALAVSRIAGIQGAKRASDWIPLCHPLALDHVRIEFERIGAAVLRVRCLARTSARTGVEMEALVGVSAAVLSLYDMAKAADKGMTIGPIQLERKTGGRSGPYRRHAPA